MRKKGKPARARGARHSEEGSAYVDERLVYDFLGGQVGEEHFLLVGLGLLCQTLDQLPLCVVPRLLQDLWVVDTRMSRTASQRRREHVGSECLGSQQAHCSVVCDSES